MLRCAYLGTTDTTSSAPSTPPATTAFLEKGEPLRERSPQHSVSTKGLGPCASQPGGPFSSRTAVGKSGNRYDTRTGHDHQRAEDGRRPGAEPTTTSRRCLSGLRIDASINRHHGRSP